MSRPVAELEAAVRAAQDALLSAEHTFAADRLELEQLCDRLKDDEQEIWRRRVALAHAKLELVIGSQPARVTVPLLRRALN